MPVMDEQLVRDITARVLSEMGSSVAGEQSLTPYTIPIGVSARHVHLSREHFCTLFGFGSELTHYKALMGGQFAAAETVTLIGRDAYSPLKARVLGPLRSATQVEISLTDGRYLGISAPVRDSGDISKSAPITIIGPKGAVYLDEACITARRHIHMSPLDALKHGVNNNDIVHVKVDGPRGGIFSDVLVRVDSTFTLEMHIDTDEANAFGVGPDCHGVILKEARV